MADRGVPLPLTGAIHQSLDRRCCTCKATGVGWPWVCGVVDRVHNGQCPPSFCKDITGVIGHMQVCVW